MLVIQSLVAKEMDVLCSPTLLLCFFSKKQGSCETSSFGSKFIAMKSFCENLRGLRCKLRMFGTPVKHLAYASGDNQSVSSNYQNLILF